VPIKIKERTEEFENLRRLLNGVQSKSDRKDAEVDTMIALLKADIDLPEASKGVGNLLLDIIEKGHAMKKYFTADKYLKLVQAVIEAHHKADIGNVAMSEKLGEALARAAERKEEGIVTELLKEPEINLKIGQPLFSAYGNPTITQKLLDEITKLSREDQSEIFNQKNFQNFTILGWLEDMKGLIPKTNKTPKEETEEKNIEKSSEKIGAAIANSNKTEASNLEQLKNELKASHNALYSTLGSSSSSYKDKRAAFYSLCAIIMKQKTNTADIKLLRAIGQHKQELLQLLRNADQKQHPEQLKKLQEELKSQHEELYNELEDPLFGITVPEDVEEKHKMKEILRVRKNAFDALCRIINKDYPMLPKAIKQKCKDELLASVEKLNQQEGDKSVNTKKN
jgi:hypothetical protein